MRVGIEVPQGWKGEYAGWAAEAAWDRTVELALHAEALGFESLWVADHFHTRPDPRAEITFESFTTLAALAAITARVRLGHLVVCAGFRNPALTAKMAGTLDVVSGGRYELGLGAGWKEDEWRAYGYGFPSLADRLADLEEQLEIVTRMLEHDRATYRGARREVLGAFNVPRGVQSPRIPIIVGGNGRRITRGLAIRFADELNLVLLSPAELRREMSLIRSLCQQLGREPATLRVSLFWDEASHRYGRDERVDILGGYSELGLDRLIAFPSLWAVDLSTLSQFAEDCRAAGLKLDSSPPC